MPSHTASSALIKLYSFNGAPWEWPAWQERTGIHHGLFPDDDSKLPKGWTRKDAVDVQSYFRAYHLLPTEEKKLSFSVKSKGTSAYPGREFWNNFILRKWDSWNIHTAVIEELKEWGIHPLDILISENDIDAQWPSADSYLPIILDSLALKLFGEEAFPNGSLVLRPTLREAFRIIPQRSWNTIRMQVNTMKNRPIEIEAAAIAAFNDLETGKVTKAKVSRAICTVAKWRDTAELFHTIDNIKKAQDMLAELQTILEGLGAQIPKRVAAKGKWIVLSNDGPLIAYPGPSKVNPTALQHLATEEDVSDVLNLYHEYFDQDIEDEEEPPISDALPEKQKLNDCGGDFGMEEEAKMTPASLAISLGYRTGIPPSFNTVRDRSGLTPWDNLDSFSSKNIDMLPDNLTKLRLHWHQLAGNHSIMRSVLSKVPDASSIRGMLIADEVGLGKTAQAIAVIAFFMQAIFLQQTNKKRPRILVERPFLGDKDKFPSLPHLIICPGTLVAQWVSELKVFLQPKSVDIFIYDNGADFWSSSGPMHHSKHQPHNQIIVASHSVLFKEMNSNFRKSRKNKKDARPWDLPTNKESLDNTLFGHSFLTVIIDEAHHMRNPGNKHCSALKLLERATVRLIMTATPLHTSSKDIAAMGRLVGKSHFFTEAAFFQEKDDVASVRRAKKLDDDGESLLAEQVQAVKRLQGHLRGHLLRRTTESLDYEDKPLLPLPPYQEILGVLMLTKRETDIIQNRAAAAKAVLESSSNLSKIQTKKFYLEYRTAVGYAKEDFTTIWPSFKTLDEWMPVKSTKMDVCAQLCAHYLTHDKVDDVSFLDGQAVFPKVVVNAGQQLQKMRRIIIFQEFSSMAQLLQNVLRLYGVQSMAINGKISFEKRDKLIREFHNAKNPVRVLIFSSIGSAGLNLSVSDIVIFFDQPWSAQDERQIRGRAHRQPQKKIVKVIHLLANDSADLLMNAVARGKRDMFDAFVNKELREELEKLLKGCIPDVHDDATPTPPCQKPKIRKKPIIVEDAISEPDTSILPSDPDNPLLPSDPDTSLFQSEQDIGTSDGEGLSDAPTSSMSDGLRLELQEMELDKTEKQAVRRPPTKRWRLPEIVNEDEEESIARNSLVTYGSSPINSDEESHPMKHSRQGTIGAEGRAQIMAGHIGLQQQPTTASLVAEKEKIVENDTSSKSSQKYKEKTSILKTVPRQFLLSPAEQTGSSGMPSASASTSEKMRPNPFARKLTMPSGSNPNPCPPSDMSHGIPNRQPGRLDDVSVPSMSALKGKRGKKAKS